jgi:hypothetical protein
MDNKQVKKLLNAALYAFTEEIDQHEALNSKDMADRLGMSYDEMKEAVDEIKRDYVIVPEGDPGLRMVETEIKL